MSPLVPALLLALFSSALASPDVEDSPSCRTVVLGNAGLNDQRVDLGNVYYYPSVATLEYEDYCPYGMYVTATRVTACNNDDSRLSPTLEPYDDRSPFSAVRARCRYEPDHSRCPLGMSVRTSQYCRPLPLDQN